MKTFLHVLCVKQLTRLRSADPRCPPVCLTQGPNCLWAAPFVPSGQMSLLALCQRIVQTWRRASSWTQVAWVRNADETLLLFLASASGLSRWWSWAKMTPALPFMLHSAVEKTSEKLDFRLSRTAIAYTSGWFTCLVKILGTINLFFSFFFWW